MTKPNTLTKNKYVTDIVSRGEVNLQSINTRQIVADPLT